MRRLLALAALFVVAGVGSVRAATINFEDLALDSVGNGGDRTSGGFFIDTGANHSHVDDGTGWNTSNGTKILVIDDLPGLNPVTFSPTSGAPFSLTSIDLSESHPFAYARQVQVTGNRVSGGPLSRLLTLDNNIVANVTANYFETFTFDSTWTNLSSVVLKGIGSGGASPANYYAIDNIVVTVAAVPEPATLSLLGLGCAYVVGRRRRVRR